MFIIMQLIAVWGNILGIIGVLHKIGTQVRVINVATVVLFLETI
jgi:hypothetical protein